MKEQIIVGMLTLSLALGFIFSIEVIAHGGRSEVDPGFPSHAIQSSCTRQKNKSDSNIICEDFRMTKGHLLPAETNICMAGYK